MQPIRILTHDQLAMINDAAVRILERTGMVIQSEEALDCLQRFGCIVNRASFRVRFPATVTSEVVGRMRRDYLRPAGRNGCRCGIRTCDSVPRRIGYTPISP